MKYRKKPVVVEAYQFVKWDLGSFPDWLMQALREGKVYAGYSSFISLPSMLIKTLEGVMEAPVGWWIIKGVRSEIYACEPEIFELTYEKVE